VATLWRLLPVTTLTVRQFTGGRTARLAMALSLIPALFAAIYVLRPWGVTPGGFLGDLFRELFLPTLLPIVVLLPATAAFGEELEDGTLPYLLMKPVTRIRLVLGKYLAVMLVALPALLLGLVVTTVLASRGRDWEALRSPFVGMAGASVMATLLLGAVFLLVSLFVPRALLAGMIYVFVWESLLGRFLPGVRAISSREQALHVYEGLWHEDLDQAWRAASAMALVAVVCLVVAIWRLRRLQLS
jgi:ABC-2 type transport system permease protein